MGVVVLIIIGVIVWLMFSNSDNKPNNVQHHRQSKADKEFEDMYFNGASGDDIDDF